MLTKKYLDYDGVKYLWSKMQNKTESLTKEMILISLSTNQGGGVTTTVKLSIDGKISEYPYDNSPITIQVPDKVKYSITLGDIENYTTPIDSNTYTATAGASRNLSYTYNACRLTFNFTPATATAKLSYKNTTVTNSSSILVPYSSITIIPDDIEGYGNPDPITITPSSPSQTISMEWSEVRAEVKIVDASGNLIDIDSWTGGSNTTGIYISDGTHSIIMAPDEWHNYGDGGKTWGGNEKSAWGGSKINVSGCCITSDFDEALLDFSGESNTDAIISQLKDVSGGSNPFYRGAPAAEYCRAYLNGYKVAGQWYLPALGELNLIRSNRIQIDEALAAISGDPLTIPDSDGNGIDESLSMWSSTQYDTTGTSYSIGMAWICMFEDMIYSNPGQFNAKYKSDGGSVRPVCQYTNERLLKIWWNNSTVNGESTMLYIPFSYTPGSTFHSVMMNGNTDKIYFNNSNDLTVRIRPNTTFNLPHQTNEDIYSKTSGEGWYVLAEDLAGNVEVVDVSHVIDTENKRYFVSRGLRIYRLHGSRDQRSIGLDASNIIHGVTTWRNAINNYGFNSYLSDPGEYSYIFGNGTTATFDDGSNLKLTTGYYIVYNNGSYYYDPHPDEPVYLDRLYHISNEPR